MGSRSSLAGPVIGGLLIAAVALSLGIYFWWSARLERDPHVEVPDGPIATGTHFPPGALATASHPDGAREEATPEESEEMEEPEEAPREPVHHVPGQGTIPPVDLTNLAARELGAGLWFRLLATRESWKETWDLLHAEDSKRNDPVEDPETPPALIEGAEAVLVVGLGERPRMDYGILLEPVAPKFGEARYRLTIPTLALPPVEVPTRPARAWFVPTSSMGKVGLVVEDEKGNELVRFDPPAK